MATIGNVSQSTLSQSYEAKKTGAESARQAPDRQLQSVESSSGGIMSAVERALKKMGLSTDAFSERGAAGNGGGSGAADASAVRKSLYAFMHGLFTVMQEQASATSSLAVYSPHMTTSIQDIIQALRSGYGMLGDDAASSGAPSAQSPDLSGLQADFQSLLTAMGAASAAGSPQESLLTFLQNLDENLNRQESGSLNFISTAA